MEFLQDDEILAMHEELLDRGGGTGGVLAASAVASANERCRWGPFHGTGTLPERAALLLRGIVQDHPFSDGNKRTAYAAAKTFLLRNEMLLTAPPDAVVEFMLEAAQGLSLGSIEAWLDAHAKPLSGDVTE